MMAKALSSKCQLSTSALAGLLLLAVGGCASDLGARLPGIGASESERLDAFFETTREAARSRWPEWLTSSGFKQDNDKWNDRSEAKSLAEHQETVRSLAELRGRFDVSRLDPQARLSYRLFERNAQTDIAWFEYRHHDYPVDHLGGVHKNIPTFLINKHQVDSRADAEAYVARLEGVAGLMDQVIERMQTSARLGIVPPRFVFAPVYESIDRVLTGAPFDESARDTEILADFRKKTQRLSLQATEKRRLIASAMHALENSVQPAYHKLARYMRTLERQANDDAGAWKFPDGEAFYSLALKSSTTTDLSADAIHELGIAEVARLHAEMRAAVEAMPFQGSLREFFTFVREDPSNFYANNDAGRQGYLDDTRAHIATVRPLLEDYFVRKPKAELVVKRVEPFREKFAGLAFYDRPPLHGNLPGTYYVNLYDMSLMPRSHMEALAYHEAIPGHHMQIAMAQEIRGLPKFRTRGGYTAYSEGWALYAEGLAKEMGRYRDPMSEFGRLAWELLRAARLVVDTGIHAKRWSRDKAIAYLDDNLPVSHEVNRRSIDRYVVWPGQATAYTIGMRKILELRERAERRLGSGFDIREFHRVVLDNGPLPLGVLDNVVEEWIVGVEASA